MMLRWSLRRLGPLRSFRGGASMSSQSLSASSSSAPPIGVVFMNMGGPPDLDGVEPFLRALFNDGEIIQLGPLQKWLGPWIAQRRAPRIREQYAAIGGKSPIGDWTRLQAAAVEAKLAARFPDGPKFKAYIAFRYAPPLTAAALEAMAADGVTRAIAFSQYPHFSCTTTGSSMNHLWRESMRLGLENRFKWSLIDRWPTHVGFIEAVARNVATGLARFPPEVRGKVHVIFSAHSVPMLVVNKGDQYVQESKVGFLPWMGPSTGKVIEGLARQGHRYVLTVPIAFTSDHVETLFEIDQEYAVEAKASGMIQFERAPSLNDSDLFTTAQTDLIVDHHASGATASPQYHLNCAGCVNPACRTVLNPITPYEKARDTASALAIAGETLSAKASAALVPGNWPLPTDAAACRALGTQVSK